MDLNMLDQWVPWVSVAYGAIGTAVLEIPFFSQHLDRVHPLLSQQLQAHRRLALVCLCVGSLWVLQTLWVPTIS